MSKPAFNILALGDNHFLHGKIIEYCERPFANAEEQDAKMIALWNATVRPGDMVIHLGDIIFTAGMADRIKEIISKLNGRKILVRGNHDKKGNLWYLSNGFDFVCDRFSWDYNGKRILFVHNPAHVSNDELHRYDYVLHGHCHNNVPFLTKKRITGDDKREFTTFVNMSVEHIKYTPMPLIPLLNRLSQGYYEKSERNR